jgi:hypothetical protein
VKGQIGPPALAHDPGPHHGPLRQRRSTRYSASSATATRRKYSTTRSSTVLIVAARKSMTCVLRGPLAVCRCHQEAPRRLVNHRHLPFANRFIACCTHRALHRRWIAGAFPHTRHPLADPASVPPDPFSTFGAAVRPETTSGGTIARRSLFRSPPKWTGGQNRERDPDKRSSGADQVRPSA